MKPESSFGFGKNYDSDYLSGKRLKRKSIRERNEKSYRNKTILNKKCKNIKEKRIERLDAIEKSKQNMPKMKNKRLTFDLKLNNNKGFNNGLFANGMTSNVITNDIISHNSRQSKARINEDLLWILSNRNQSPKERPNVAKHKSIVNPIPEQQNNKRYDKTHDNYYKLNRFNEKQKTISQINRMNESLNRIEIKNKNNDKKFTQTKTHKDFGLQTNGIHKKDDYLRVKSIPSVPSHLSIVQNLMKSYENERKEFAKYIEEFDVDLVSKTCHHLRTLSHPLYSRLNKKWIENQIHSRVRKKEIKSNDKQIAIQSPDYGLNETFSDISFQSHSKHNYNDRMLIVAKPKEPDVMVGQMVSKILRNVSEGQLLL
jgi:hypothetical protein